MDKIQARWNLNKAVSIMGNSKLAKAGFWKHVYDKLSAVNKKSMATICRDWWCKSTVNPSKPKK